MDGNDPNASCKVRAQVRVKIVSSLVSFPHSLSLDILPFDQRRAPTHRMFRRRRLFEIRMFQRLLRSDPLLRIVRQQTLEQI